MFVKMIIDRNKKRKSLKQEALEELDDILETLQELFYETSKSSCGYDCAMTEVNKGIDKIREAIKS